VRSPGTARLATERGGVRGRHSGAGRRMGEILHPRMTRTRGREPSRACASVPLARALDDALAGRHLVTMRDDNHAVVGDQVDANSELDVGGLEGIVLVQAPSAGGCRPQGDERRTANGRLEVKKHGVRPLVARPFTLGQLHARTEVAYGLIDRRDDLLGGRITSDNRRYHERRRSAERLLTSSHRDSDAPCHQIPLEATLRIRENQSRQIERGGRPRGPAQVRST
jgi:hypothetical protein